MISSHPGEFEVEILTAVNNAELLIKQSIQHVPNMVVIGNEEHYELVKDALRNHPIKVFCGEEALAQVVGADGVDMVLTAMVGFSGLQPTIEAIRSGKDIALANKETMVVAGELINMEARLKQVNIITLNDVILYRTCVNIFRIYRLPEPLS